MKILWSWSISVAALMVGLLLTQVVQAAASAPVTHTHGGRSHTHPLPVQGVNHRHGNSAYGRLINRSGKIGNTGNINGRPTPSSPAVQQGTIANSPNQKNLPPRINPVPTTPNTTGRGTLGQQQPTQQAIGKRYDKADTRCARNARDCNVCAVNVRQQFAKAANGQINWRTESWRFNWNKAYPSQRIEPINLFAGKKKYLLGIPDKHMQGFVHTNSPRFPYAGSHSHRKTGGILLVNNNPQGEKQLAALFKTRSKHPSGVHAIGQYLAYGENGKLFLKDLEKPSATDLKLPLPGPQPNFGGGIGLVKLASGGHLMMTTGPGGQDQRPRFNRFYYLRSRDARPRKLQFINQSPYVKPAGWPAGFGFAENLSLISECGTGDIYAVHTTGEQKGVSAIRGQGYWRLSKVIQQGKQLRMQPVSAYVNQQSMDRCSMRATATVYVNPDRRMEFYCHGYAKDPKGSTLNVLGKPNNVFRFMVGVPR